MKISLLINFAKHTFLSESLFQLGLSILNLFNLLVLHQALWNGSFMKSDRGVTYIDRVRLGPTMSSF